MAITTTKDIPHTDRDSSYNPNVFRAEVDNARREREQGYNANPPPGYPSNVHTIHSSSTTRQQNRLCPNAQACWPGVTFEAFSPFNCEGNTPKLMRRLCMSGVLAIRTGSSILSLILYSYRRHIAGFVISIILAVLGFFFVAWCLKEIGNMSGQRRVFGKLVGRWHYDIFLLVNLVVHVGILVFVVLKIPIAASDTLWILMWLAMFAAAWVATWPAENDVVLV
jgi:hypothetical protein